MRSNTLPNDRKHSTTDRKINAKIKVPSPVFSQLDAVRRSGTTNMYTEVIVALDRFGFDTAREWVETNPDAYCEGISKGFSPANPDEVQEIDVQTLRNSVEHPKVPPRDDATTDLEQHILDYLEGIFGLSEAAIEYYTDGEWRKTVSLTTDELELAHLIKETADCRTNQCYRNALITIASFGDRYDLTYVEGYVMTGDLGYPLAHGWIELNGKVVELTFESGIQPRKNAAYLGKEFPHSFVKNQVFSIGIAESLAK